MWWISECYCEVINQVKEHHKSNPSLLSDHKVNEDKHEVDRTSADKDKIDDVTFWRHFWYKQDQKKKKLI